MIGAKGSEPLLCVPQQKVTDLLINRLFFFFFLLLLRALALGAEKKKVRQMSVFSFPGLAS